MPSSANVRLVASVLVCGLLTSAACTTSKEATDAASDFSSIARIAILRVDRGDPTSDPTLPERAADNPNPRLAPNAETVITAHLYGVLSNDPRWRLVPDVDVEEVMREVPLSGTLESRAQSLGKATGADVVITGVVSRFQERVGTDYGSRFPASVSFELRLVGTQTGEVLWRSAFDQTQRDLSTNLLDFWMFWSAGPKWFTAAELAQLGVEKLVDEMDEALEE